MDKAKRNKKYGKLAREYYQIKLPITVLESAGGYYIGTTDPELGPVSRESVEYFLTQAGAKAALDTGNWAQRETP
jgi:hypothetical protein